MSGSGAGSPSTPGAKAQGDQSKTFRRPAVSGGDGGGRGDTSEAQKQQVAQLAEMGVSIPEQFRPDMAMAGEWEVVSEKPVGERGGADGAAKVKGVRKRKMPDEDEGLEEGGEAGENASRKPWGSTFRTYPGGGGGGEGDAELDMLLGKTISLKREKRPKVEEAVEDTVKREGIGSSALGREVKREEGSDNDEAKPAISPEGDSTQEKGQSATASVPGVKSEDQPEMEPKLNLDEIPAEPETTAPAVVFKKRKPRQKR